MRVRAAGINFADLMARAGLYPDAPKPPCVVGYEFAGELETAAGDLPAGTRVMGGCRFGAYSERVAALPANLIPLPESWSFAEGAALPVAYVTAYAGLVRYGGLRAGERVLIQAAAGGVGIAATQVAKLTGAEVYGAASPAKHEAIASFGVDHPLDYDFVPAVRRIAGERRAARPGVRRDRRRQLPEELLAAAPRRPARLLRGVARYRVASAAARCARRGCWPACRASTR